MASSKVKGTNGKPLKTSKNRDKLKASIHIDAHSRSGFGAGAIHDQRETVRKYNDGDPHVYVKQTHTTGYRDKPDTKSVSKSKTKNPTAANPIKDKPAGVRGLPAIHRKKTKADGLVEFRKHRSGHNKNKNK